MPEFPLNYKNMYEINTTPEEATETWSPLASGIASVEPGFEDETDDTPYYDGDGFSSQDVTGVIAALTFTGHRVYGDAAQDFVESVAFEVGQKRKTQLRWTRPDGKSITGDVTLSGITTTGGDANAKSTFEVTATFNGKPSLTP